MIGGPYHGDFTHCDVPRFLMPQPMSLLDAAHGIMTGEDPMPKTHEYQREQLACAGATTMIYYVHEDKCRNEAQVEVFQLMVDALHSDEDAKVWKT